MGCFFVELNRLGNTPTPTIERVGATPTAELDYLSGVPLATLIGLGDTPTAVLEHLGGMTVSGSLLCYVSNDTLTISETSLSFTSEDVGVQKTFVVFSSSAWTAELIDPDGLFEINRDGGLGGVGTRMGITLVKANPNIENYSASVVFKSRGLRQTLGIVAEVSEATYTPLTYIEATGAQYINTGYVVQEDDVIEMFYISTLTSSADKALFGVAESRNGLWTTLFSNTAYVRFGSTASVTVSNARMRYKLSLRKGKMDIDGSTASPVFAALPTIPLYVFALNNNNSSVNMYGYCRSMGFKISKASGEVVMDLKPCKRNSDGKVGMLDLVSGQFFTSAGSEEFITGAELNMGSDYEAIDYVTFDADKLFDAGIIKSTYKIEVLFERTNTSGTPYLYGIESSPHTTSVTAYLTSSGSWRWGSSYRGFTSNTTKMYKVEISNGTFVGDFSSASFTKSSAFTTPNTLVVGGYRDSGGGTYEQYKGYLYYFRIKEGDTYIADWYPCRRKSDGEEGFWDCVSQTFVESI